jgi:hypothetical protein
MEYPPPQPLDGEIDRMMETDDQTGFIASDTVLPGDETLPESSKHPDGGPTAAGEDDVEEIGSEDEEEDDEEAEIDLDEEEIDEEEDLEGEGEGEEDEEMAEAEGENGDDTMQSIENHAPHQTTVSTS